MTGHCEKSEQAIKRQNVRSKNFGIKGGAWIEN
jgi:hypothetical protein